MQKKFFLAVVMLLTVPVSAQVTRVLPASPLATAARMAARDQGYDLNQGNIYFREILAPDGEVQNPRYLTIGLYQDDHLLTAYDIRIATGDVVDPDKCEILRYPNLLKFKRAYMRKRGTHEVSLNLITSEVACDNLRAVGGTAPALSSGKPSPSLKQELTAQHFSLMLTGDVTFRTLGTFRCGNKHLRVIFYAYNTTMPGVDPHETAILFMDGKTYLGWYAVEYPPEIHGDVLQFPPGAYGDTITCGKKGVLPQKAWLDGKLYGLFK